MSKGPCISCGNPSTGFARSSVVICTECFLPATRAASSLMPCKLIDRECEICNGEGEIEVVYGHPNDPDAPWKRKDCEACDGSGVETEIEDCGTCTPDPTCPQLVLAERLVQLTAGA